MGKQHCIRINKNGTKTEKDFKTEDNQIIDGKNKVTFTPNCVFPPAPERFSKFKFWKWFKTKRSVMIFIEGALHALRFVVGDDSLQTHWNKKEAQNFVHKMVVLESMSVKPLKLYQFIILMIGILINAAGIFYLISLLMR